MLNQTLRLTASALMIAIVGAVCACHSDKVARPPAEPTVPLQALRQPSTFVGTVPVQSADEKLVTPMETVAAAWYGARPAH